MATYLCTTAIGLPLYIFLRRRQWTAFWIYPLLGFGIALLGWELFARLPGIWSIDLRDAIFWPIGLPGLVTGAVMWLVGRPDRPID